MSIFKKIAKIEMRKVAIIKKFAKSIGNETLYQFHHRYLTPQGHLNLDQVIADTTTAISEGVIPPKTINKYISKKNQYRLKKGYRVYKKSRYVKRYRYKKSNRRYTNKYKKNKSNYKNKYKSYKYKSSNYKYKSSYYRNNKKSKSIYRKKN
jgi:hypothetical protein